jgi:hypothetical protein
MLQVRVAFRAGDKWIGKQRELRAPYPDQNQ